MPWSHQTELHRIRATHTEQPERPYKESQQLRGCVDHKEKYAR